MSFCASCGAEHEPEGRFCAVCGRLRVVPEQVTAGGTPGGGSSWPEAAAVKEAPEVPTSTTALSGSHGFTALIPGQAGRPSAERIQQAILPAPKDALKVIRATAQNLVVWLVLILLVTTVLALTLPETGHHGSPADWARAASMVMCAAFRSPITLSVDGYLGDADAFGSADVAVTVVPILLTLGIATTLHTMSRRHERSAPSPDLAKLTSSALCSGLTTAAATALLAVISSGNLDFGLVENSSDLTGVHVSASPVRVFFGALIIASLAALTGRLVVRPAPPRRLLGVSTARRLFLALLVTTVAIGIVAVAVSFRGGGSADTDDSNLSVLAALALFIVNGALLAGGMLMGGTLSSKGDLFGNDGDLWTGGLFAGHLPGYLYFATLVVLGVVMAVGIRSALHRRPSNQVTAEAWPAVGAFVGLWVLLLWLTNLGMTVHASGDIDNFRFAGYSGGLGLASTLFSASVWILLCAIGGTVTAQVLAGVWPRLALRFGGKQTHPDWKLLLAHEIRLAGKPLPALLAGTPENTETSLPDAPWRMHSRRERRILIAATFGAVGVVGLGAAYSVVSQMFTPQAVVARWYESLDQHDASAALALLQTPPDRNQRTLLTDKAITSPPTKVSFEGSVTDDNGATVSVTTRESGEDQVEWSLHRDGRRYGIFPDWKIDNSLASLSVSQEPKTSRGALQVNGIRVPPGDYPVFPGTYRSQLAANGFWTAAKDQTRTDGLEDVQLTPIADLDPGADGAASDAVKAYLDSCAGAATTLSPDCPFSDYWYNTPTKVHWTIRSYPLVETTVTDDGSLSVSTASYGTAHVKAKANDAYFGPASLSEDTTFAVDGTLNWDGPGTKATFTPRPDDPGEDYDEYYD